MHGYPHIVFSYEFANSSELITKATLPVELANRMARKWNQIRCNAEE
jgi:hypothetical protein